MKKLFLSLPFLFLKCECSIHSSEKTELNKLPSRFKLETHTTPINAPNVTVLCDKKTKREYLLIHDVGIINSPNLCDEK